MSLEQIMQPLTDWITSLPFYNEFGIVIVFLLSFIPFMPFPAEPIVLPLVLAQEPELRQIVLLQLTFLMSVGTLGSLGLLYYVAKHHLHKLIGKRHLSPKHPIHKYGMWAFAILPLLRGGIVPFLVLAPSLSIIVPIVTDLIIIMAGHYRIHAGKLFAFLTLGVIVKGIIDYLTIAELVGI